MEILKKIIELVTHYSAIGTLACSIFIVYKIAMASSSRWSEREQSYYVLLQNLGSWNNSLSDRLNYYIEPGSENKDDPNTVHFRESQMKGVVAYQNIRNQLDIGRIFLSNTATNAVEELLGNYWYIAEYGALCTADYLRQTKKEVQKAYDIILIEAKRDLTKNRRLKFVQKLVSKEE
jgi:hypothetical protein